MNQKDHALTIYGFLKQLKMNGVNRYTSELPDQKLDDAMPLLELRGIWLYMEELMLMENFKKKFGYLI